MTESKRQQASRLAWWGLTAVVLYHLGNAALLFLQIDRFGPAKERRIAGLSTHFPSIVWKGETRVPASSRKVLEGAGYAVRHWLGQESALYFRAAPNPFQRLYNRKDGLMMDADLDPGRLAYPAHVDKLFAEAKCHGVRPFAVFVPPRAAIERNRLPAKIPPVEIWRPLSPWREETDAGRRALTGRNPDEFLDLYAVLRAGLQQEEVYVPWDYHLTSFGEALVTAEIVRKLNASGEALGDPQVRRTGTHGPYHGDILIRLLKLPNLLLKRPEFAWREPLYEVHTPGKLERWKRVVLAGTSFTERLDDENLGLRSMVERALHVPVVRKAMNGATFDRALAQLVTEGVRLEAGDILVLEQPLDHILREAKPYPAPWSTERDVASKPCP